MPRSTSVSIVPPTAEVSAESLARSVRALADPLRLRLLNALAAGELCVCDLVQLLRVPQPTISRHLNTLRSHGLVAPRRVGRFAYYRLAGAPPPAAGRLLAAVAALAEADEALAAERRLAAELAAARAAVPCSE